jgi:hypothetical protein
VRGGELNADEGDMLRAVGVWSNQDRIGSELAVNDLAVMERLERLADPTGDAQGSGRKERAARIEDFTERGTLGPLDGHEQPTIVHRVAFVYSRHTPVGVRKQGQRVGLIPHRVHECRVCREFVPEHLQRDQPLIPDVLCRVNDHVSAHRGNGVDTVSALDDGSSEMQAALGSRRRLSGVVDGRAASHAACP